MNVAIGLQYPAYRARALRACRARGNPRLLRFERSATMVLTDDSLRILFSCIMYESHAARPRLLLLRRLV